MPSKQVLLLWRATASHDGTHERVPHAPRTPGGQAGCDDDPPREWQPRHPYSRKHAGRHTIGDARSCPAAGLPEVRRLFHPQESLKTTPAQKKPPRAISDTGDPSTNKQTRLGLEEQANKAQ